MNPSQNTASVEKSSQSESGGSAGRGGRRKDAIALGLFIFAALVSLCCVFHGINQPLIDLHTFRQTQTALSTYWIAQSHGWDGWVHYQTPVLGYPWTIPFEFPLYQWIVAACYKLTGLPLDPIGRSVNAFFFYACFAPLYFLLRDLRFDRRFFFLASAMVLASPVYAYWSRGFLIESTVLFFSFCYLAFLQRHLVTRRNTWLALATAAGIVGILVKVTTFVAFAAGGGLAVLADICINQSWKRPMQAFKTYAGTAISIGVIGLILVAWVHYADAEKAKSMLGATTTSAALHNFNYGTLAQRVSVELWKRKLIDRMVPDILGSTLVLGIALAAGLRAKRRSALFSAAFLALFMVPIMMFTNLHIEHDYYQYANAIFAVLAVAVLIWDFSFSVSSLAFLATCAVVLFCQLLSFYLEFFPFTSYYSRFDTRLQIAETLKTATPIDSAILVLGDSWKPTLAYYSRRKAIYLNPATPEQASAILADPEKYTGGIPTAAVVVREDRIPSDLLPVYKRFREGPASKLSVEEFGEYRVFFRIPAIDNRQASEALDRRLPINPAAEAMVRRNSAWMEEMPASWSGDLKQSAASGRFDLIKVNGIRIDKAQPVIGLKPGSFLEIRGWQGDAALDRADKKAHRDILVRLHGRQSGQTRYAWAEMGANPTVSKKDTEGKDTQGGVFKNGFQTKFRIPGDLPADLYDLSVIQKSGSALVQVNQGCALKLDQP